jgi:starvation-inducible outer membrane lipoprotein
MKLRHALAACLVLTACASDSQKFSDSLDTTRSWLASVHMVSRAWIGNRVPVRFARQLVDEATSQLERTGQSIASLDVDQAERSEALDELTRATQATRFILAALERRDVHGVDAALPAIAAHITRVDSLSSRAQASTQ